MLIALILKAQFRRHHLSIHILTPNPKRRQTLTKGTRDRLVKKP
jgi:hypothetical protein